MLEIASVGIGNQLSHSRSAPAIANRISFIPHG
jgi:hypothetical protein